MGNVWNFEGLSADSSNNYLKQLEFQAVFDLSIAITRNKPETGFFEIMEAYLLEKLGISHLSIFNFEDSSWSSAYCYGRIISGWRSFPRPDREMSVSLLADLLPELSEINRHVDLAIPFYFDSEIAGMVLCQKPLNFLGDHENEVIALIQTLLGLMAMARENQKLLSYRLKQESMRKEIEIARQVQKMLFPKNLPDSKDLHIYATYLPHMDMSGDYYDFIDLKNGDFAVCVADVSGKGIPAALLMSNFQASLRTLMMDYTDLGEIVNRINTLICMNSNGERFITAFIAIFDSSEKTIHYVNCGHIPPILIYADGSTRSLRSGCTILGIFNQIPSLSVGKESIGGEALLVAFTDGLPEVEDKMGNAFGQENLENYFVEHRLEKLPIIHQRLLNRIDNFASEKGFHDDLTLLTIRFGN